MTVAPQVRPGRKEHSEHSVKRSLGSFLIEVHFHICPVLWTNASNAPVALNCHLNCWRRELLGGRPGGPDEKTEQTNRYIVVTVCSCQFSVVFQAIWRLQVYQIVTKGIPEMSQSLDLEGPWRPSSLLKTVGMWHPHRTAPRRHRHPSVQFGRGPLGFAITGIQVTGTK